MTTLDWTSVCVLCLGAGAFLGVSLPALLGWHDRREQRRIAALRAQHRPQREALTPFGEGRARPHLVVKDSVTRLVEEEPKQ